ncbi:MAG TPA: bifunctional DNA-binding transcriptional regulator/O6-methylguanine-DNA methyltransferase Ada [Rhodanobacteraceae bacterium]|nr:bifunctional DNA-binding transcriptional regulator/O6-methylguanine-DNA methyltransferase Ada [Rhodanobacteraceae bacterium]
MHTHSAPPLTTLSALTDAARWAAVVARDAQVDGRFVYAVRSTGVYCRPSCGARQPRRENVTFHAGAAEAERAGFRPCKRCHPDQPAPGARHRALIEAACRHIEQADTAPTLAELATEAGLSPFHFHRVFKTATGVTPKAYARVWRARRARQELTRVESVTDAIYAAGFQSSARFYADAPGRLGMTPTQFRAGGVRTEIRFAVGQCSLGAILVAATAKGICGISFGDDPQALVDELQERFPRARLVGGDPAFEQRVARVVGFVETPRLGLDLPLDIRGTAFQQRVWQALRAIPVGATASYSEVAMRLGAPQSARAVAAACAANPLAVAIPCHRVVRRDGGLSGYRWGVERKRALLAREQVA